MALFFHETRTIRNSTPSAKKLGRTALSLPLICTKEGVMDLQYDSITKPNKASTHFNKRGFCSPKADPIELP